MPFELRQCYIDREECGLYSDLVKELQKQGKAYLLNCEYKRDFIRHSGWQDGFEYHTPSGSDFRAIVFGEIRPAAMGTQHSAIGSHYKGDLREGGHLNHITDKTRVKDTLVLSVPTGAPTALMHLFNDQIVTLNEVIVADMEQFEKENKDYVIKEWVSASTSNVPADQLLITMPAKYKSPNTSTSTPSIQRLTKRSREYTEKSADAEDNDKSQDDVKVSVGTLYDPALLYDYGGPLFQHVNSKLVQHEIVDVDGKTLIPPWEQYEKLNTGTLVMATVSLSSYAMKIKDKDGKENGKERRGYQLRAHKVRVIDHSNEPVDIRQPFRRENGETPSSNKSPVPHNLVDDTLSSFVVRKRVKLDDSQQTNSPSAPSLVEATSSKPKHPKTTRATAAKVRKEKETTEDHSLDDLLAFEREMECN